MTRQFDLHRLRLLRELKHRGTITAVAAAMAYSHSSVSQQLKVLEGEVGVSLLEPDGRGVRLTPHGEVLVEHIEAILVRLDQADADLAGAAGGTVGTFKIATFQTVMISLMPTVLTILKEEQPGLSIELVQADPDPALSLLQLGEFDLVFDELFAGEPLDRPATVNRTVLHRDTMRLAVPPDGLPMAHTRRVEELANASWVLEPPGSPARKWAEMICAAAGFRPNVHFESADVVVHERLVRGGHAVAFLPDLLWAEAIPMVGLRELPRDGYRDIICSVRAGTADHPGMAAAAAALHLASAAAAETIASRVMTKTDAE